MTLAARGVFERRRPGHRRRGPGVPAG